MKYELGAGRLEKSGCAETGSMVGAGCCLGVLLPAWVVTGAAAATV